jgi:uncharacterized membrane protein (DUF106 family)
MLNCKRGSLPSKENVWLKKKALNLIVLALLSYVVLYVACSSVLAQQAGTNIEALTPESGAVGSQVNIQGTINASDGSYLVYFGEQLVVNNASAEEQSVDVNFTVPNLTAGNYNVTLQDVTSNNSATKSFTITAVAPTGFSAIPWSTLIILAISVIIAFLNGGINRLLVSHFVGWEQYGMMQKEMAEYRSQQMAAMRANDKKQLEKLKKKEAQIMNMQKKMAKPQVILFGVSFVYIVVWIFVLTPTYGQNPVAYLPGFGAIPVFYWYPICSLLFGTLSSRILGILPIN